MTDPSLNFGLPEAVASAKSFADLIFKPPLAEIGGLLGDTVGGGRLRNRVRVLCKSKKLCEEAGINPAVVLPDVFVPLVDAAGNTDDETLSDMFARLLTTHVDPERQDTVHPSFAQIIAQMSSTDGAVLMQLDELHHRFTGNRAVPRQMGELRRDIVRDLVGELKVSASRVSLSLDNLQRLGLLASDDLVVTLEGLAPAETRVHISTFGDQFLRACNDPKTYWRNLLADAVRYAYREQAESRRTLAAMNATARRFAASERP